MAHKTSVVQSIDPNLIMDLLDEAGIGPGEEVLITVEPGRLSVRKDPVAELWGALATPKAKSPRELIDEAIESQSGRFYDSDERDA